MSSLLSIVSKPGLLAHEANRASELQDGAIAYPLTSVPISTPTSVQMNPIRAPVLARTMFRIVLSLRRNPGVRAEKSKYELEEGEYSPRAV